MDFPLVLQNFTKKYGSNIGALDISLQLNEGEVFGFLGPNGAGKTTTIRTILNFLHPTEGSITVFGQDSVKGSIEIKKRIGYLAGDIALYPNMTGRQLLVYLTSLGRNTDWEYVDQLQTMLEAEFDRPIKDLSKGNKQKIGLIQSFMHKPDLILLDEPTSGLDPLVQQVFYDIVDQNKQAGKTLFISSHNLQEVQRLCDRAAFIRNGKLIGIEDIKSNKKLTFRRYSIRFEVVPSVEELQQISGVSEVSVYKRTAKITVTGSPNDFFKGITRYDILDFGEEETNLEDVFMHYYKRENNV